MVMRTLFGSGATTAPRFPLERSYLLRIFCDDMHTRMPAQNVLSPRGIRQLDGLVRETLTEFSEDLDHRPWCGKEHDFVNRYAHGFLLKRCSPKLPLKHATQIGIEVGVAQPKRFLRKAARKDLVIWPKPWMSCWNSSWEPTNHPIAVLEWKVRLKSKNLRCDHHDEAWLSAFARAHPDFVGYSVTLNRTRLVAPRMCVARFYGRDIEHEWLTL